MKVNTSSFVSVVTRLGCTGLAALAVFGLAHAQFSFEDQDFQPSVWISFGSSPQGTVGFFTDQPGDVGFRAKRYTVLNRFSGISAPMTYVANHLRNFVAYSPATDGPITKVNYEMWMRTDAGGHNWNVILYQNNSIYMATPGEGSTEQWPFPLRHERTVNIESFVKIDGPGPSTPDMSATAPPIFFGWRNYNNVGLRAANGTVLPGGAFSVSFFRIRIFRLNKLVSGTIDLQDYAAEAGETVAVEIIQGGTAIASGNITLGTGGSYAFTVPIQGNVEIRMKGRTWLAQNKPTFLDGDVVLNYSLKNGDINGDNEVSAGDFSMLAAAYDAVPSSPNWNRNADLDGNNEVGAADFSIFAANYDEIGD